MRKENPNWLINTTKAEQDRDLAIENARLQEETVLKKEEADFLRKISYPKESVEKLASIWEKFELNEILNDLANYLDADRLGNYTLTFEILTDLDRNENVVVETPNTRQDFSPKLIQLLQDRGYSFGSNYARNFKGIAFESIERSVEKEEEHFWNNGDDAGFETEINSLFSFKIDSQKMTMCDKSGRSKTSFITRLKDSSKVKKIVDKFLAEGVN